MIREDIDKYFSKQQDEINTKGASESKVYNIKFDIEKGEKAFLV